MGISNNHNFYQYSQNTTPPHTDLQGLQTSPRQMTFSKTISKNFVLLRLLASDIYLKSFFQQRSFHGFLALYQSLKITEKNNEDGV